MNVYELRIRFTGLLSKVILFIPYLSMNPKRHPRKDHNKYAGHVNLYKKIASMSLKVK